MMRSRVVLVDLPEDGRRVMNCTRFPAEQTARPTTYLSGKGEFRSWKNTNCCVGILRRSALQVSLSLLGDVAGVATIGLASDRVPDVADQDQRRRRGEG